MKIKVVTPPQIEPVTVEDVKLCAHIDHDIEDKIIAVWIKTARELAENYQKRAYITQILEQSYDNFPSVPFYLVRPPLIGVMTIKYTDSDGDTITLYDSGIDYMSATTTTGEPFDPPDTNSDFIIDVDGEPGRIDLAYLATWPTVTLQPINSVKIRYAAGYGDYPENVPEYIKDAIMLYCVYRNENRAGEVQETPSHFYNLLRQERF